MKVLLDTHIALWAMFSSDQLPAEARRILSIPAVDVWVSVACIWEIGIKHTRFRGDLTRIPISAGEAFAACQEVGYGILPIRPDHVLAATVLPRHHNDPFDRIMVGQAEVEAMQLITTDNTLKAYGGAVLSV